MTAWSCLLLCGNPDMTQCFINTFHFLIFMLNNKTAPLLVQKPWRILLYGQMYHVHLLMTDTITTKQGTTTLLSALLALGEGNPPVTGGFPSQRASNLEFEGHDTYCDITVLVFIFQGSCCNKCCQLRQPSSISGPLNEDYRQLNIC